MCRFTAGGGGRQQYRIPVGQAIGDELVELLCWQWYSNATTGDQKYYRQRIEFRALLPLLQK